MEMHYDLREMPRSTPAGERTPQRRVDGRERLLDTAERLFAERGIDGVSLREITEAAGQRNASVVQYHFGSRAGLLAAIVERHMSVVDAERMARLDAATSSRRELDVHEAMRILVEPLADRLQSSSGRSYLRVLQHLVDLPVESDQRSGSLSASNPSVLRATALLTPATRHLPRAVQAERQAQTTSFLLRALADRAAATDSRSRSRGRTSHGLFVANLVDVLVAVLTAPASPTTVELAGG
jgi:AcrR family transcriptional regulator